MFEKLEPRPVEALASIMRDNRLGYAVQPVKSIADPASLLYGECLARLVDEGGNVKGPTPLISHLEQTGTIDALDECMLGLVLNGLSNSPRGALGCNISAATMQRNASWRYLRTLIAARPDLAARLVIEVTETHPVEDVASFIGNLAEARALGCRIAIDDFGVGAFSPSLLLGIDVDIVKIDASMLKVIHKGRTGMTTLEHIVGFAACIAPFVVIEGVEDADDLGLATSSGATHAQGYFLAPPGAPCFDRHSASLH